MNAGSAFFMSESHFFPSFHGWQLSCCLCLGLAAQRHRPVLRVVSLYM